MPARMLQLATTAEALCGAQADHAPLLRLAAGLHLGTRDHQSLRWRLTRRLPTKGTPRCSRVHNGAQHSKFWARKKTSTVRVCDRATASLRAAQYFRASLRPSVALPQQQPRPAQPPSLTSHLLRHTRQRAAHDELWQPVWPSSQCSQQRSRQLPCVLLALLAASAHAWRLPLRLCLSAGCACWHSCARRSAYWRLVLLRGFVMQSSCDRFCAFLHVLL